MTIKNKVDSGDWAGLLEELQECREGGLNEKNMIIWEKASKETGLTAFDEIYLNSIQSIINNQRKQRQEDKIKISGENFNIYDDVDAEKLDETYFKEYPIDETFFKVLDKLFELGVKVDVEKERGASTGLLACTINNTKLLEKLIENKIGSEYDDFGEKIVKTNNFKVKVASDGRMYNALYYAVFLKAFKMVNYLEEKFGLDLNETNIMRARRTILHQLAENSINSVECSINKSLTFNLGENSNEDAIVFLLSKGVKANVEDDFGQTPEELIPEKNDDLLSVYPDVSDDQVMSWDRIFMKIGVVGGQERKLVEEAKKSRKLQFDF